MERQRTEWIENRQAEIERKIAEFSNPELQDQLREKEQKKFEVQKRMFDADFENALKIARWKPYDQNAKEDWFDPEWMFRIMDGYDITIGNPPYVRADADEKTRNYDSRLEIVSSMKHFMRSGICLFLLLNEVTNYLILVDLQR